MAKPITENQKKLMGEAFKQGFIYGKMGGDLEVSFKVVWDKLLETTFSKPEWKPYIESARESYHFCFEHGFAAGVQIDATPEKAFSDWFKSRIKIVGE